MHHNAALRGTNNGSWRCCEECILGEIRRLGHCTVGQTFRLRLVYIVKTRVFGMHRAPECTDTSVRAPRCNTHDMREIRCMQQTKRCKRCNATTSSRRVTRFNHELSSRISNHVHQHCAPFRDRQSAVAMPSSCSTQMAPM